MIVILSECENLLLSHPEFCAAFIGIQGSINFFHPISPPKTYFFVDTLAIHVEELPDDLSMFHSLEENVVIHSFNVCQSKLALLSLYPNCASFKYNRIFAKFLAPDMTRYLICRAK